MRPDLGQVERIVCGGFRLSLCHDLHHHPPFRESAILDRLVEVALVAFAVAADECGTLLVGQAFDALHRLEVELDPEPFIRRVDETVGVRAVAVHVAVGFRQAAIGEEDCHLVQALGALRPEVPHRRGVAQIGPRIALLSVDEVREFVGVAHEENRRVVADQVPIALIGIEFERKATHVALGIGRPAPRRPLWRNAAAPRSACRSPRKSSPWNIS